LNPILNNKKIQPRLSLGALLVASVFVSGCVITPKPLTPEEQTSLLAEDREATQKNVEPVGEVLTLHEAIARGLKYNLDHRSKMMETAIALGRVELSKFDMLPKVLATAGYSYRNNDFVTISRFEENGQVVNAPRTITSEREYLNYGFSLNWSLLDFGVSYYNAKQTADRVLVASERRRRNMHVLIQDIQVAYLRAASAVKLKNDLLRVIKEARETLDNAKKVEAEGLRPLLDTLRFQKSLLDNMKTLELIDQELSSARAELNQLVNLPTKATFKFEDPDTVPIPPDYSSTDLAEFEIRALLQNADLNESVYNARIAHTETRKALLNYFPGLSASIGSQRSDNSFYINKQWIESSAQLSLNLWSLLSAPDISNLAKAEKGLAQQKRMIMQMAVVTQVHLAKQSMVSAKEIYRISDDIASVDTRLAKIISDREAQGASSKAEKVAAESSAIVSRLRKYQALSQLFAASGRLQASTGLEPEIPSIDDVSITELTAIVRASFDQWNSQKLPPLPQDRVVPEPVPYTGDDNVVRARYGLPLLPPPEPEPAPVVEPPKVLAPEEIYSGDDPVVRARLGLPPAPPAPPAPEPVIAPAIQAAPPEPTPVKPMKIEPAVEPYTGDDPIVRARLGLPPLPPPAADPAPVVEQPAVEPPKPLPVAEPPKAKAEPAKAGPAKIKPEAAKKKPEPAKKKPEPAKRKPEPAKAVTPAAAPEPVKLPPVIVAPAPAPTPLPVEPTIAESKVDSPQDIYTGDDPIVRARLGLPPLPAAAPEPIPVPVVIEPPKVLNPDEIYSGDDPIVRARLGLPPKPQAAE
jgi:outer membrane protein TolC